MLQMHDVRRGDPANPAVLLHIYDQHDRLKYVKNRSINFSVLHNL